MNVRQSSSRLADKSMGRDALKRSRAQPFGGRGGGEEGGRIIHGRKSNYTGEIITASQRIDNWRNFWQEIGRGPTMEIVSQSRRRY